VANEARTHLRIRIDQRLDHVRTHPVLHPRRGRRNQPLGVELIRVDEIPHQRHLIVGLVGDVGHHHDARLRDIRIGLRRARRRRRLRRWLGAGPRRPNQRCGDGDRQRSTESHAPDHRLPPFVAADFRHSFGSM
jgi:hypothetical protein